MNCYIVHRVTYLITLHVDFDLFILSLCYVFSVTETALVVITFLCYVFAATLLKLVTFCTLVQVFITLAVLKKLMHYKKINLVHSYITSYICS